MAEAKETIHSYDIVKQIGSGSFGMVYLVTSKSAKDPVPPKPEFLVMKQISLTKLDARQRLDAQKEILLLSTLTHPNIVSYRHSFENDIQQLHIIMDYCDGGDLYRKIFDRKRLNIPFEEDQLMQWFVQVCLALKHIHERKILHRDLKTQNIFACDGDNIVKLGDFGIARILDNTADLAATCIGTPYYLSPEVCQNRPYGTKTDVWALGCVLYELATFQHPFEGRHLTELLTKIVRGTYEPLPTLYSPKFKQLVGHMLKVSSSDRPDVNGLLQRDFVYEHASTFLKKWRRHDELAFLEELMKDKRTLNHRPIGVSANPFRRHVTPSSGSRHKSGINASKKAYLEKKYRMYMAPPSGLRSPKGRLVRNEIMGEKLQSIAENHVPADPVPPVLNLTVSVGYEEKCRELLQSPPGEQVTPDSNKEDQWSPGTKETHRGSSGSKKSPTGSNKDTQFSVQKEICNLTVTIKPKVRERKKWTVVKPPGVTSSSGPTISSEYVPQNDPSTSNSASFKPKSAKAKIVAPPLPSIPGSVDDGWPANESHICETCGCQFVTGSQRKKQQQTLKKQCQACRLVKKEKNMDLVDGKSIYEKIECLREELEQKLGFEKFTKCYREIAESKKTGEIIDEAQKNKMENLIFLEKAYFT